MLGWGRNSALEKRANLLVRMTALVMHGLQTKTYEQFIASFSNPGAEPDTSERQRRELHFLMQISRTCEYCATASYPREEPPWAFLQGDGDDFGVFVDSLAKRRVNRRPASGIGRDGGPRRSGYSAHPDRDARL